MKFQLILSLAVLLCACGGGGSPRSSTPTAPTAPVVAVPTLSGLSITNSSATLLIGQGSTLTATGSYSDGTLRIILPGWSSSNGGVISIDGSGRVTAVAPGSATITASAEGRTATTQVRGLPDFSGNWSVQWRYTTCDVPPRWGAGFCNVSGLETALVNLQRSGTDGIVGSYDNGIGWVGTVSGQVAVNGTLSLTGRLHSPRPSGAVFYRDFLTWNAQLTPGLGFTGSHTDLLTWVGERDQGFTAATIVRATR